MLVGKTRVKHEHNISNAIKTGSLSKIRALTVEKKEMQYAYDVFALRLISIRRTKMAVWHVDQDAKGAHVNFPLLLEQVKGVLKAHEPLPSWITKMQREGFNLCHQINEGEF